MNIGELFIALGLKGADKTRDELQSVRDELKGTAEESKSLRDIFASATPFKGWGDSLKQFVNAANAAGSAVRKFLPLPPPPKPPKQENEAPKAPQEPEAPEPQARLDLKDRLANIGLDAGAISNLLGRRERDTQAEELKKNFEGMGVSPKEADRLVSETLDARERSRAAARRPAPIPKAPAPKPELPALPPRVSDQDLHKNLIGFGLSTRDADAAVKSRNRREEIDKTRESLKRAGIEGKSADEIIRKTFAQKGGGETEKSVKGIEDGLKKTKEMSLAAKAAILGAVAALHQMFSKSGEAGTELVNFKALTGGSLQTLQQYQYAARQVGISNEETAGTFVGLQNAMTKIMLGKGAPAGYAQVAMLTGGITSQDVQKFMQNPELLLQRLQLYAQKEKRLGIRNEALKSFGLSDSMIAGLSRQAFTPQTLNRAPTYSDKEAQALDKANIAWSNLAQKIQMAFGHFNAAHGGQIVGQLSQITDKVLALSTALLSVAEKLKIFEIVKKTFDGLNLILGGVGTAVDKIGGALGSEEKSAALQGEVTGFFSELPGVFKAAMTDLGATWDQFVDSRRGKPGAPSAATQGGAGAPSLRLVPPPPVPSVNPAPRMPAAASAIGPQASNTNNYNVTQQLTFTGNHDPKKVGEEVKQAVGRAFRQQSSQVQVT